MLVYFADIVAHHRWWNLVDIMVLGSMQVFVQGLDRFLADEPRIQGHICRTLGYIGGILSIELFPFCHTIMFNWVEGWYFLDDLSS